MNDSKRLLIDPIMWCTKCQQETQYQSWTDDDGDTIYYLCKTCGSTIQDICIGDEVPTRRRRVPFGIVETVSHTGFGTYTCTFIDRPQIFALWFSSEHLSQRTDDIHSSLEYGHWIRKDNQILTQPESFYIEKDEPNQNLLGRRVITPDDEQGFVSEVYADGIFDVDILDEADYHLSLDENETFTTSVEYSIYDDDVDICENQTPQLHDLTPHGIIGSMTIVARGVVHVRFLDTSGYALYFNGYEKIRLPDEQKDLFLGNWLSYTHAEEHFPQYNTVEVWEPN